MTVRRSDLPHRRQSASPADVSLRRDVRPVRRGARVVAIVMLAAVATAGCSATSAGLRAQVPQESAEEFHAPEFTEAAQFFPASGLSEVLSGDCTVTGVGQLTLAVPPGADLYFAKLVNRDVGALTLGVTIAAGQSATVEVPVCWTASNDYDLAYASGTTWFGYDHAFGPQGSYSSTSEMFEFEDGTWWEVELIRQAGGNLGTSGMDYDDF